MSTDKNDFLSDTKDKPLFSFGVIADVQYADIDNKENYEKTAWRHYRRSIDVIRSAIQKWNSSPQPISFVLQMGDLIDGFNTLSNSSEDALKVTLDALSQLKGAGGIHHTLGNHELYNFSRDALLKSPLNSNPDTNSEYFYYSFNPHPGFRVVVMDSYGSALIGYKADHPEYKEALALVQKYNKNEQLNSPQGLQGMERRFCKLNGGVGRKQLAWLEEVLTLADQEQEHVVIIGHIPVHPNSSYAFCMLWNYDEVLSVFHRHKCVRIYMSGHDHDGGYAVDEHGIHHVTVRGLIEAVDGEDPTITGHVYDKRLELHNLGPRKKPIDKIVVDLSM